MNINVIILSTVIHSQWLEYFLVILFSLHFVMFMKAYFVVKVPFTLFFFQIAAFSDGHIKVYELTDPLDLKSWQLQVINLLIFFQIF